MRWWWCVLLIFLLLSVMTFCSGVIVMVTSFDIRTLSFLVQSIMLFVDLLAGCPSRRTCSCRTVVARLVERRQVRAALVFLTHIPLSATSSTFRF
ncbi:hypothetical protein BP00DRAFT_20483 [Aspergillus indologenus CBS 114.80]|uniref:Secreted peptide n=1 Tax=Aspergillus indologenus CBS 114.80 TaxID=1450541 RepID=A0A2V5HUJ0_9EURO|nr:hypothetical protein BP00DRAFT_20483 [Aspergillus indologenus CBS 114.80]